MPFRCLVLALAVAAAFVLVGIGSTNVAIVQRVSVDSDGNEADRESYSMGVSGDGRYVVFLSGATNLVVGDSNQAQDVFVRDVFAGTTTRVSVDSAGGQANNLSMSAAISQDGRYVAFSSGASNLVPGDANAKVDVFVRDMQTGVTEIESLDNAGLQGNGHSDQVGISPDGLYVAYTSAATNLVPDDTNGKDDVFVRDRDAGTTERVSVDSAGNQGNSYYDYPPSITDDGRYVSFQSFSSNLVPGDTNANPDVFVHDRVTGETERVSLDTSGGQLNGSSYRSSISADGRFVVWDNANSVYLRDLTMATTELVSVDPQNESFASTLTPSITADGRYIAFFGSIRLDQGLPDVREIWVRDRQLAITSKVSVNEFGTQASADTFNPHISASGRYVTFYSSADNLDPPDTNSRPDAFLTDLGDADDDDALDPFDNCASTPNVDQSDGEPDGVGDACDNCPSWSNVTQALPSWPVPSGDSDCDGFPDTMDLTNLARETYIGTDPAQHCAVTAGANNDPLPDAWPPDFNDDRIVNGQDSGKFGGPFGAFNKTVAQGPFGPPGQELPGERFDFSGDGIINGQDTGKYQAYFNKSCA